MKTFPALALLIILAFVPGCGPKAESTDSASATPAPTPIIPTTRIGFFAPLTGSQETFGQDAIHGAQMAVDEINATGGLLGQPLELVTRDTFSLPDRTAQAVTDLITIENVSALIGEIATDRSLIAAPIAQEHGIPMITPASTNEKVTEAGDFVFRTCYTDSFQAVVMAKFARSIQVEKAAIFYDAASPYGVGLAETFKEDFEAAGGKIVAEETYAAGDMDFSRQLNAIRAKGPEVVFLPSYYAEAALIIREARMVGLEVPFLGTDGWDSPDFLKVGGKSVDNCYFSGHFSSASKNPRVQSFVHSYTEKFGTAPPPLAALTYDSVYVLADALRRAESTDPAPIRDALAGTADFEGVTGKISLDAQRNPSKSAVVIRLEDGKFTFLETVDP